MPKLVEIGGISWDPANTHTLKTDDIPQVVEAVVADNQRMIDEINAYVLQQQLSAMGGLSIALGQFEETTGQANKLHEVGQALAGDSGK